MLVSGGVDSSVCAALLHRALGPEKIWALHIDHGFMRHEESSGVVTALQAVGVPIRVLNGADDFAQATTDIKGVQTSKLCETVHPEAKRKIIGDTFMVVTQKMVDDLGLKAENVYLAQGTLRPDLIESASAMVSTNAECIKTHHNDTQLVRRLRDEGRILEPLQECAPQRARARPPTSAWHAAEPATQHAPHCVTWRRRYHKDEVRELGISLGLPAHLVWRQPFPGPGLAIRILCADEPYLTADFDNVNEQLKQARRD